MSKIKINLNLEKVLYSQKIAPCAMSMFYREDTVFTSYIPETIMCKDYFGDVIFGMKDKIKSSENIYGLSFDYTKHKLNEDYIYLMLKIPNLGKERYDFLKTSTNDYLRDSGIKGIASHLEQISKTQSLYTILCANIIKCLNNLERSLKFKRKSSIIECRTNGEFNIETNGTEILLEISSEWLIAPYWLSFVLLTVRNIYYYPHLEILFEKNIEDNHLGTITSVFNTQYLDSLSQNNKMYNLIMQNKIDFKKSEYTIPKFIDSTFHNHHGFISNYQNIINNLCKK